MRRYETPAFIAADPISVPHAFEDPADQEVIGLYAALLAWGRRSIILAKLEDLCGRMGGRPYAFVRGFRPERDAGRFAGFKHRTFCAEDALWLTCNLRRALEAYGSVGGLVAAGLRPEDPHIGPGLQHLSDFLSEGAPRRLRKHLPRPSTGSACKRLAMYARWMARPGPVDLGLWPGIHPRRLILPLDVHAGRTARALGLLARPQDDWRAALALTERCRDFAPEDPCRYDFAFFGAAAYADGPMPEPQR